MPVGTGRWVSAPGKPMAAAIRSCTARCCTVRRIRRARHPARRTGPELCSIRHHSH
ncbi:hypothetical protein ACFFX0_01505 [Citricoccus parietis]|uniref:Uncharacterized protein n=1 Tax=Citricoccus parietis TaxID=592307 RepID=A0ABV5FTG0_9MICC